MADWILVPCLVGLREEFNELSPGRAKASDGSVGDTAHSQSSSDHNPDETGRTPYEDADSINEVHAIDVDSELRKSGWTMQRCVNIIVGRHRSGADDRLQNVIYNRKIASRSWGWTWRDYTGASPHTEHAHFSSRYTTAQENDRRPWGLLAAEKGEDDDGMAEITQERFTELLKGAINTDNVLTDKSASPETDGTTTVRKALERAMVAENLAYSSRDQVAALTAKVDALQADLTAIRAAVAPVKK